MDKRETQDSKRIPNPLLDPSADKYDYLLVFKKIKQPKSVKVNPATGILVVGGNLSPGGDRRLAHPPWLSMRVPG